MWFRRYPASCLGADMLTVGELERLLTRPWFIRYTYADVELEIAGRLATRRRAEFLTGRFAGKEAVLKVLGTGLFCGAAVPREIAIARRPGGEPDVCLSGAAAERAKETGVGHIALSITHKKSLVLAVAFAPAARARGRSSPSTGGERR